MKSYPEIHQQGLISIENIPTILGYIDEHRDSYYMEGDLGVQIANDGRVWVCVDGVAFLRFKPKVDARLDKPKEHLFFNNIREAIRVLRGK
jgi:hypothetical protein